MRIDDLSVPGTSMMARNDARHFLVHCAVSKTSMMPCFCLLSLFPTV